MKILSIGSDRNLFIAGSAVSERIREQAKMVEELHIVVLSNSSHNLKVTKLDDNVWLYPTNSSASILRPLDAAKIGKRLVYDKGFVRGNSLITCQDIESGWAGLKIKNKWRIPLELQLHTDIFSPYFSGFQNKVRKFFAKGVLQGADSIRVVSQELKSKLQALSSKLQANIFVLPIYVDRVKIEGAKTHFDIHTMYPWHFILLAVARLTMEKNLGDALKVLAKVRERFPDTGLLIVGSGPEKENLKFKIKNLKLEGYVDFAGWQNELASYYRTANVFIQTSFFEGYGLSLVEAGLSGLPVVTTNVGLAEELESGKDAYIYPVGRPDLMAQGVIDLINHNQKRENLRFNLRRTLEAKLISKDEYLKRMKDNWEKAATLLTK